MVDVLRIKRRASGGAGAPTTLLNAELAFNEVDNILYYGKGNSGGNATSIIPIAGQNYVPGGPYLPLSGGTVSGALTLSSTLNVGGVTTLLAATGTTVATADNSTSLATTAFVKAQAYAPLASPTFTGTPTLPTGTIAVTQAAANNTTAIATTAYVKSQAYVTGGPYLPLTGGTISGGLTVAGTCNINGLIGPYLPTAGGQITGVVYTNTRFQISPSNASGCDLVLFSAASNYMQLYNNNNGMIAVDTALTLSAPNGVKMASSVNRVIDISSTGGYCEISLYCPGGFYIFQLASDRTLYFIDQAIPAYRMYILPDGTCKNTTGTWSAFSDVSLKQNVNDYTTGLSEIIRLRPVTFEWLDRDFGPNQNWGLVAQEVEPVMPELVGESPANPDNPTMVKTVDYGRIIFSVINALREVSERLSALEAAH